MLAAMQREQLEWLSLIGNLREALKSLSNISKMISKDIFNSLSVIHLLENDKFWKKINYILISLGKSLDQLQTVPRGLFQTCNAEQIFGPR